MSDGAPLPKDPNANVDFTWDWSQWLPVGDTIATAVVTAVSGGVVIGTVSNTTTTVTAWVSGGTNGTMAKVMARVTTAQGRIDDRTLDLDVRNR